MGGEARRADSVSFVSAGSSVQKGESLLDTVWTLESMGIDLVVVRHQSAGVPLFLARRLSARVINAGDGAHEHPTQGLLDARTLLDHRGLLAGMRIAIVGDVAHSRRALGAVGVHAPRGARDALRADGCSRRRLGAGRSRGRRQRAHRRRLEDAVEGADAVMALRLQVERMERANLPSVGDYARATG